mgnify:CR=1 FL=1
MKKTLSVLLIIALGVSMVFAGGASEAKAAAPAASGSESAVFADVKPLGEKTQLKISTHAGTHHGFLVFLIEQFGGFEKANIDAEIITFSNGPVQMEALSSNSWDCGTTGIGGVLNGVLRNGCLVLGPAAWDNASINIFAKNSTDIAKSTAKSEHGVIGSAEQWKGKEVIVTKGTTLHYALGLGLADIGLTLDDVSITNMDVASANTALLAQKIDIGGIWGTYSYNEDLRKNYTKVMDANALKSNICITLVANPNSYADAKKKEAIAKFVELYYKAVDWVYADNGANLDQAAQYYANISEQCGVTTTKEAALTILKNDTLLSLKDAYEMFNDKTANGTAPIYEGHRGPLQFYVEKIGSYTPADLAAFSDKYFVGDIVNSLYKK